MAKLVIKYRRVSTEEQAKGQAVSLDRQDQEMDALIERMGWRLMAEFEDSKNYTATKAPRKGKSVNPSGKRDDRPGLLAMLDSVKTGAADIILCWRDDRLYRHERVVTAIKDALEEGESQRRGKEIEIWQATGPITRDWMYLQAMVWRKENERRVERTRMGKIGTLETGRWPGVYDRLGYDTVREPGKRGRKIVLASEEEQRLVRNIFSWCAAGLSLRDIRDRLIALGVEQKLGQNKHAWGVCVILVILRARDYMGEAIWHFNDGTEITIKIPQIIEPKLWHACQKQLERNKALGARNTKEVYLLQGLLKCGECGGLMSAFSRRYDYRTLEDGTKERTLARNPSFLYYCNKARLYPDEPHPRPYSRGGAPLDWAVWRKIVDCGIKQPHVMQEQVEARQEQLREQGESLDGDIAHARAKIQKIDQERAFYQRQAARGKMTETEFDERMDETEKACEYWQSEIDRLKELRDDTQKVDAGLLYASEFLESLQETLPEIDIEPDRLKALPKEEQDRILARRRDVIRALCDEIRVYADGHVEIDGVLDGTESAQFDSTVRPGHRRTRRHQAPTARG